MTALRKLGHFARNRYTQAGVALSLVAVAGTAAAEPTGGAAAIAALSDEATTMIDAAWPVVILVTGAVIGIKLFKKFANRAT
jgi:hypothetical protein